MQIHAYQLTGGDSFIYGDREYTALAEPTGEFNTYIKVASDDRPDEELFIRSHETVTYIPRK